MASALNPPYEVIDLVSSDDDCSDEARDSSYAQWMLRKSRPSTHPSLPAKPLQSTLDTKEENVASLKRKRSAETGEYQTGRLPSEYQEIPDRSYANGGHSAPLLVAPTLVLLNSSIRGNPRRNEVRTPKSNGLERLPVPPHGHAGSIEHPRGGKLIPLLRPLASKPSRYPTGFVDKSRVAEPKNCMTVVDNAISNSTNAVPVEAPDPSLANTGVLTIIKNSNSGYRNSTLPSMQELHQRFGINFSRTNRTTMDRKREDEMLIHLKENLGLAWADIGRYFPWKASWHTLQSRYSKVLNRRNGPKSVARHQMVPTISQNAQNRMTSGRQHRAIREPAHLSTEQSVAPGANNAMTAASFEELLADYDPKVAHQLSLGDIFIRPASMEVLQPSHIAYDKQSRKHHNDDSRTSHSRIPVTHERDKLRTQLEKDRNRAGLSSLTKGISRLSSVEKSKKYMRGYGKRKTPVFRPAIEFLRPYLSERERQFLHSGIDNWNGHESVEWDGQPIHVDFAEEELERLEQVIVEFVDKQNLLQTSSPRIRIQNMLQGVTESIIRKISFHAQDKSRLSNRSKASIESFLWDASKRKCIPSESVICLQIRSQRPIQSISSSLRCREGLGLRKSPGMALSNIAALNRFKMCVYDSYGPSHVYTGTSGDVGSVAWSPNGITFAAGSAALMDEASMQYNLPHNLLVGNAITGLLHELPDHAINRPLASSGVNATLEMYVSQDILLYTTISSVRFSTDGGLMFSAGYDKYARVWDVTNVNDAICVGSHPHLDPVDLLETASNRVFATGATTSGQGSIQVIKYASDETLAPSAVANLSSNLACGRPESHVFPTCMRWGSPFLDQERYLICGFGPPDLRKQGLRADAEICLWDVARPEDPLLAFHSNNPFDIAWSSTLYGRFAIGSLPGYQKVNRGTKSVVRIYDSRRLYSEHTNSSSIHVSRKCKIELECPALDMNDLVFSPFDDNMICVGCTDGCTYVWDLRNPDDLLQRLEHGKPLMELDDSQPLEQVDTGVRLVSWGESRRRIFTGSSDGIVKSWDPYLCPEDTHIQDVATLNSGVMSGAFNADFSKLLIGEVNGSITLLSVGHDDYEINDAKKMLLRSAAKKKAEMSSRTEMASEKSGKDIARELVQTGQIEIQPIGDLPVRQAVQGVRYVGPFDRAADAPALRAQAAEFQRSFPESSDCCTLNHGWSKVTEEEQGDSRTSETRIPDRLRYPEKSSANDIVNIGCFRCQKLMDTTIDMKDGRLDTVICYECQLAWRIDILGFNEIPSESSKTEPKRWKLPTNQEEEQDPANQVDYYYNSQWQDRPPSPL